MENELLSKYKGRFKKIAIFNIAAGGCVLLALLLFMFVDCFEIKLGDLVLFKFSIFADVKRALEAMFSGGNPTAFIGIYLVFSFIILVSVAVNAIVVIIRNILNLIDLDKYTLLQFDKIKYRSKDDEKYASKGNGMLPVFIVGVVFEIVVIIVSKYLTKTISSDLDPEVCSYFMEANSVSWTIMIFIIFAVCTVSLCVIANKLLKDVAFEVIKQEYANDGEENK